MSVKVLDLKVNGPAYAAGLRLGDRIYDINGVPIDTPDDIAWALRNTSASYPSQVRVRRGDNWSRRTFIVDGVGRRPGKKTKRLGIVTNPELVGNHFKDRSYVAKRKAAKKRP